MPTEEKLKKKKKKEKKRKLINKSNEKRESDKSPRGSYSISSPKSFIIKAKQTAAKKNLPPENRRRIQPEWIRRDEVGSFKFTGKKKKEKLEKKPKKNVYEKEFQKFAARGIQIDG